PPSRDRRRLTSDPSRVDGARRSKGRRWRRAGIPVRMALPRQMASHPRTRRCCPVAPRVAGATSAPPPRGRTGPVGLCIRRGRPALTARTARPRAPAMRHPMAVVAAVLVSLRLPTASGQEWPREPIPAPRIRDAVRAHDSGLAVWWTGHNGWLVKADGLLVGTDLATDDEARLYQSPITAEELAPLLDVAFITHGHGDHFHRKTARVLAEKGRCTFVMPANCVAEARRLGIPEGRITVAAPRRPFEVQGVRVSPLRAIHGNPRSAVHYDANLEDCGYLIEVRGTTFLQPGDSVLL